MSCAEQRKIEIDVVISWVKEEIERLSIDNRERRSGQELKAWPCGTGKCGLLRWKSVGRNNGASETAQGAVDCVESLLRLQVRSLFLPGSFQNAPNRTETCRAANQCQIACP